MSNPKFAIIAGHGGDDHGVVYNGLTEKDVNLEVGKKLVKKLIARGVDAVLIRDTDKDISLGERGRQAEASGATFGISLHVNAVADPETHAHQDGLMAFHWPENRLTQRVAQIICQCVPRELHHGRAVWPVSKHDWRKRAFNVVRAHKLPVVLVEMGFATNKGDAKYLQSAEGQEAVMDAIVEGLAFVAPQLKAKPAPPVEVAAKPEPPEDLPMPEPESEPVPAKTASRRRRGGSKLT